MPDGPTTRSTGEDHTELDRDDALAVVRALPSDQEVVVAILDEAATWLRARGSSQWPSPFPSDIVAKDIACSQAWLVNLRGEPVGTVTLLDTDRLFWGDATERALYLHRFAVRRANAGVGRRILEWTESYAAELRRAHVRLDCVAANTALRGYYERAGYICVGQVSVGVPSDPQALYEKKLR